MEFNIGDKVVYPSQGVSVVESITDEELGGAHMQCYNLRLMATDSKVVVPVNNADRVELISEKILQVPVTFTNSMIILLF